MRSIDKHFSFSETGTRFFALESLTREGAKFGEKGKISLLADEDILYIMKNVCSDDLINEYFSRNSRRHPIWKSEAEYRALFDNDLGKNKLDEFEIAFKELEKYLIDHFSVPVINDDVLKYIEKEEEKLNKKRPLISDKNYQNLMLGNTKIKRWVFCLKKIAHKNNIPYDFSIISANKFKSGFLKQDLEKIPILFPSLELQPYIKEVSTILTSEKTRDSFFYLFYRDIADNTERKEIPIKAITKALINELFSS